MGITTDTALINNLAALVWIVVLGVIALACPNTLEIVREQEVSSDPIGVSTRGWMSRLAWRPSLAWATASALVLMVALGSISRETAFLYYRF